jgi:hypothetical protein
MKKIRNLVQSLFIFASGILPLTAQAQGFTNTSFREGEKLTFKVFYNMGFIWINSGTADFTVTPEIYDNESVYHLLGVGRTAKSFEWFYKVMDTYESYVDKETMLPKKFVRHVNEGGMKINNEVSFDHSKGEAISDKKKFTIPKHTIDVVTAMYYARNINYNKYKPGDKIPFTMFLDNQVYNLYIKYIGKEKIETRMGTFNAIKIAPLLIEGTIFKDGNKMTIWLSDDSNHLPVRVESPILIGSVKIDLMEYQNLKNPFSGMISQN